MRKNTIKRLAVALRFDLVVRRVKRISNFTKNVGRKGYGDVALLKSKVLSSLYGAHSDRELQRKLQDDKELRQIFNLNQSPDHSCYSKWIKRKGIEFFQNVMKELIQIAMRIGLISCSILAVDSTGINAFVSKIKENYETDQDAAWGYLKKDKKGKQSCFTDTKFIYLLIVKVNCQ